MVSRKKKRSKARKKQNKGSAAEGSAASDFSKMTLVEMQRYHGLRRLSDLSEYQDSYGAEEVLLLTQRLVDWGYEKNPIFHFICQSMQSDQDRVAKNSFSYQCVKHNLIRTEPLEKARHEKLRLAVYLQLEMDFQEFYYREVTIVNFDPNDTQLANFRRRAPSWNHFMSRMFAEGADFTVDTGSLSLEKMKLCVMLQLDKDWEEIALDAMEAGTYDTSEAEKDLDDSGESQPKHEDRILPDFFPPLIRGSSPVDTAASDVKMEISPPMEAENPSPNAGTFVVGDGRTGQTAEAAAISPEGEMIPQPVGNAIDTKSKALDPNALATVQHHHTVSGQGEAAEGETSCQSEYNTNNLQSDALKENMNATVQDADDTGEQGEAVAGSASFKYRCIICNQKADYACSGCLNPLDSYCSLECQKAHWKIHKHTCQRIPPGPCNYCKETTIYKCGKCGVIPYCNKRCAKRDRWIHKFGCHKPS